MPAGARWLLLIHQIPPKPDYLRVKIGRRLQRVGAVAIKNSVYALPANPVSHEDFHWIMREIEAGGGSAFISDASLSDGLTDAAVRARFDAARNVEYQVILADAKALMKAARARDARMTGDGTKRETPASASALDREFAKLRRRHEAVVALDFFGASGQRSVAALLASIQDRLRLRAAHPRNRPAGRTIDGATWVTRRGVHVDRMASAWLIRRFIDRHPAFKFVDVSRYTHRKNELRFDMFDGEYTHAGDDCTFETLVAEFVQGDAALREIAEIVHDIDCKDGKFQREEAAGVARVIAGIVARHSRDEQRIGPGAVVFDDLYAAFSGARPK
jgi:hypothetical protein